MWRWGVKRSKNNEKKDQQDWKPKRKLVQNASKWSNDRFGQNIRPILSQIISGTKCDRDKQFFCRNWGAVRSSWA